MGNTYPGICSIQGVLVATIAFTLGASRGTRRKNLVFAAVGDNWSPSKWSFSKAAGWDLAAVYFGNRTDWSCPQCTLALRMPGAFKWQMVWALMAESEPQWRGAWQDIRERYEYVMVADDDIVMDACTIDIVFQSMRQHGLLVAQPSNCRGSDSDNPYWVHWQLPGLELHYVNLVEVTAPTFDMAFLDRKVRPFLQHSYSGWGLPFCFFAAAQFAHKRMAAIDTACMVHPARRDVGRQMSVSERIRRGLVKAGSIYARFAELTPYGAPKQEQLALWEICGFNNETAAARRQAFPPVPSILGTVLAPGSGVEGPQAAAAGDGEDEAAAAADDDAEDAGVAGERVPQWRGRQQQGQQLEALATAGRLPRAKLPTLMQLGLAAAAGAIVAVVWDRRLHRASSSPLHNQLSVLGSRSPHL